MTNPRAIVVTSLIVASVTGSLFAIALLFLRSRSRSSFIRGVCLSGVILVLLAMPWLTDFLLLRLNTTSGLSRIFIDLGLPDLLVPVAIVFAVSALVARRFQPAA